MTPELLISVAPPAAMDPTSSERHGMGCKGKPASRLSSVLQGQGAWGWEESFGNLPEFQTGHHISNVFMPVVPWHPFLPPLPQDSSAQMGKLRVTAGRWPGHLPDPVT